MSRRYENLNGMYGTPEYRTWVDMKTRCFKTTHKYYNRYGGRGIEVCDRWLKSFAAFYKDMGPRPSNKYSIDRIDNDGNYEPDNCRWATSEEQARNKPNFVISITYKGKTKTLAEWASELGVHQNTMYRRYHSGWSVERMLEQKPSNKILKNSVFLEYNGKRQTTIDWSRELGLNKDTVRKRLCKGWSIEKVLSP